MLTLNVMEILMVIMFRYLSAQLECGLVFTHMYISKIISKIYPFENAFVDHYKCKSGHNK